MKYIDPRGIRRKLVAVDEQSNGTFVTFDCGHVSQFNQIYHYRLGDSHFCFKCGQEAQRTKRD